MTLIRNLCVLFVVLLTAATTAFYTDILIIPGMLLLSMICTRSVSKSYYELQKTTKREITLRVFSYLLLQIIWSSLFLFAEGRADITPLLKAEAIFFAFLTVLILRFTFELNFLLDASLQMCLVVNRYIPIRKKYFDRLKKLKAVYGYAFIYFFASVVALFLIGWVNNHQISLLFTITLNNLQFFAYGSVWAGFFGYYLYMLEKPIYELALTLHTEIIIPYVIQKLPIKFLKYLKRAY